MNHTRDMWRIGTLLLTSLLMMGCSGTEWSEDALRSDEVLVQEGEFFPSRLSGTDNSSGRTPVIDGLELEYYSALLRASGEPPLPSAAQATPEGALHIRFIWIPSFHSAVIARISPMPDGRLRFIAERIPTMSDMPMDRASIDRLLTDEEARAIDRLVKDSTLLLEPSSDTRSIGIDGARWIIEASDREHYHLIERWSPSGPVNQFGVAMLRMTGWEFEAIY